MKKAFTKILSAVLAVAMVFGIGAMGIGLIKADATEVFEENGYSYTVSNGEATVTGGPDGVIPDTLGGYPVTKIGERAFYWSGIRNITIPDSVKEIGDWAFRDNGLTVTFGENSQLEKIGWCAFYECTFESFTLPESVKYIGDSAFGGCINLEEIVIGDNVETIGGAAFSGCNSLKKIHIGKNVKEIGTAAFYGNLSITEITVSSENKNYTVDENGVLFNKEETRLIKYASLNKNESYIVPNSVKSIDAGAFAYSYYLKSVTLPEGIIEIPSGTFGYCINLESVIIPETVESIGESAFAYCYSLKKINIPAKTIEIYPDSFSYCLSLEAFDVSSKNNVFYTDENGALYIIDSYEGRERNALLCYPCSSPNTTFAIPEKVTAMYSQAFGANKYLKEITFHKNFDYLTDRFSGCISLEKIWVDENHAKLSSDENGILYNKDKTKLIFYPVNKQEKVFVIPETVTSVDYFAFVNSRNLSVIVVHKNMKAWQSNENPYSRSDMLTDIYYEGTSEEWGGYFEGEEDSEDFFNQIDMTYNYSEGDHIHDYTLNVTTASTCGEYGKGVLACSCGVSKSVNLNNIVEHIDSMDNYVVKEITSCTSKGAGYMQCELCNGIVEVLYEIAVQPHDFTITATSSTATAAGALTYDCNDCDAVETTEIPVGARYIIFDNQGKEAASVYFPGDAVEFPETPEKAGFDFLGWVDENGDMVDITVMPDKNLELSASFGKVIAHNTFGVTATFDEDCFENGSDMSKVELVVSKVNDDSFNGGDVVIDKENSLVFEKIGLYNIKMTYEGNPVKFNTGKTVKVKIPVGTNAGRSHYQVIHKLSSGGKEIFEIDNPSEYYQDDCLIIEVSGFSEFEVYAVTDKEIVKEEIKLVSAPTKTNYTYKVDSMDLSGIAVEITKIDGTKETVTDTSKMKVVGFDNTKIGTQTVTVECEGQIVQFEVSVSYAWWQWIIRILFLGFLWY